MNIPFVRLAETQGPSSGIVFSYILQIFVFWYYLKLSLVSHTSERKTWQHISWKVASSILKLLLCVNLASCSLATAIGTYSLVVTHDLMSSPKIDHKKKEGNIRIFSDAIL